LEIFLANKRKRDGSPKLPRQVFMPENQVKREKRVPNYAVLTF
jgi:hypothetical protein